MKMIILAAGMGTRLGGEEGPKALTTLANGRSILELQLDNLSRYAKVSDVRVVVGYHAESIQQRFPQLTYIVNHQYSVENTSQSLRRALEDISDEDVLWLNGDVVFHHSVLPKLLLNRRNAMIVDTAIVGEEEVKYRTDDFGRILEISKNVGEPAGEALGINFFSATDLPLLKEALEECEDNDYFERAVQSCIDAGVEVWTATIDPELCVEIDFPEDLDRANGAIRSWPKDD